MKKKTLLILFNSFLALGALQSANGQGTAFTYQGKLTDDCCPATGYYDFIFKVYDSPDPGTPPNTQVGGTFATNRVPVTNGLFTVRLDFDAPGSTVSAVFTGARRWLQLEARTNNSPAGFVPLLPRTELTPTPYAIHAGNAATLNGQSATAFAPASGSSAYVAKAGDTMTGTLRLPGNGLVAGTSQLVLANGNVGIGTANPAEALDVAGNAQVQGYLALNGQGNFVNFYSPGNYDFRLKAEGSFNNRSVSLYDATTGSRQDRLTIDSGGNVGIGTPSPSKRLEVHAVGDAEIGLQSDDPGGRLWTIQSSGTFGNVLDGTFQIIDRSAQAARMVVNANGYVGIGTPSPAMALDVAGGWGFFQDGGGIHVGGIGANGDPKLIHFGDLQGDGKGYVYIGEESSDDLMVLRASRFFFKDGNVGIGTANPQAKLQVNGDLKWAGNSSLLSSDQTGSIELGAWEATGTVPYIDFHYGVGTVQDYNVRLINDADRQLTLVGNLRVNVLTITGGADLAEPFQMSSTDIPKGALVTIDEGNPGQLKMSECAYDTRVAGILSGANGINPGIQLHQQGALEGGQNVALSGRVYALADASNAPIKPGDLLTTSATPGHCMKVTDHAKAQGAIIGKAMSALDSGKGMVLVLVSLQ